LQIALPSAMNRSPSAFQSSGKATTSAADCFFASETKNSPTSSSQRMRRPVNVRPAFSARASSESALDCWTFPDPSHAAHFAVREPWHVAQPGLVSLPLHVLHFMSPLPLHRGQVTFMVPLHVAHV